MTERTAIGVDWASGSWLAVVFSGSDLSETKVFDEIETLWDTYQETADRIVVDVPIGLCESREAATYCCEETDGELSRRCDDLARTVISPRSSSVFTPPAREAARMAARDDDSYSAVNALNKELTGKGIMQQAANISDGIVEVEDLLLEGGGEPDVLVEGHPELCFRAFKGEPLDHSKKSAAGVEERLDALENVAEYDRGEWRKAAADLRDEEVTAQIDDVLDALALALTACASDDDLHTLPADPPRDHEDLPMQMVYRAEAPLINPPTT